MAFNEGILTDQRPNFFELLAEESMREALRPALEYVCKILARSRPDRFAQLRRSRDEIYFILDATLQWCFLQECNGSFSEYFYSLQRLPTKNEGKKFNILLSMISLVAVPYLKIKIERLHSILSDENDSTPISWFRGQSRQNILKFIIFKSLPYIQSLWTLSFFTFRVCYLMDFSTYYSPLHWLSGVNIIRLTSTTDLSRDGSGRMSSSWVAGQILSISLFILRLVQWWYSREHESIVRKTSTLPIPPPPSSTHTLPSSEGITLPSDVYLCPLCDRPRIDPTTLSTSGFVFCYECISNYIDNHGKCPLTLFPTSREQIIKLFITHHH